jgi:antitoxin (DNA-binding transcriptional repressor) of toxin-antitoxin stability system
VKKASVTETKNNLSAILQQVKEGETYLILDRGKLIARLEPVSAESRGADERRADLERRGLIRRGRGKVRKDLVETPPPQLPDGISALAHLLQERREGR